MNTITASEAVAQATSAAALLSIARFNDRVAQTKEREGGSGRDNRQAAQALRLVAAEIGLPARGQRRAGNDNAPRSYDRQQYGKPRSERKVA